MKCKPVWWLTMMNKSAAMPGYPSTLNKSKQPGLDALTVSGDQMPLLVMTRFLRRFKNKLCDDDVSIQMIYSDQKNSSPLKPFLRSENNFHEILRFGSSSFLSFLIDIGLFSLIFKLLDTASVPVALLIATGFARVISSGFNFTLNKKFVFFNKDSTQQQLIKYYFLCTLQMFFSWLILYGLSSLINGNPVLLKIITDTFLFMISYIMQRLFIFRRTKQYEKKAI